MKYSAQKSRDRPWNSIHPEIAAQADGWQTSGTSARSTKPRQWRCDRGHDFVWSIRDRLEKKKGCWKCLRWINPRKISLSELANDLRIAPRELKKFSQSLFPRKQILVSTILKIDQAEAIVNRWLDHQRQQLERDAAQRLAAESKRQFELAKTWEDFLRDKKIREYCSNCGVALTYGEHVCRHW